MSSSEPKDDLLDRQAQLEARIRDLETQASRAIHDLNNMLTGIQGRTSFMMSLVSPDHPHAEDLQGIEECVRRASERLRELSAVVKQGRPTPVQPREQKDARERGTVLIVDDEPIVIRVGTRILEKLGCNVLQASSGEQAIRVFEDGVAKVGLIIVDVNMPGMTCEEVVARSKELKPEVKVLLASGGAVDDRASHLLRHGCNGFLPKPFDIKTFSETVLGLLGS
jgi:CheY-like chemotaxis protein